MQNINLSARDLAVAEEAAEQAVQGLIDWDDMDSQAALSARISSTQHPNGC